ncbi:MAG: AraC family transcriptional regulator, partial [Zwartia sp.]
MLNNPIGFFLVPTFPLIALASALDPLRIANRYISRKYEWQIISTDGEPVPDANGSKLEVDCSIDEVDHLGTLFVCADHHAERAATKRVIAWLKRLDRSGTILGAIDSGAFTLARAGLLEKTCITLHWEVIEAFRERFPNIYVTETLFEADK